MPDGFFGKAGPITLADDSTGADRETPGCDRTCGEVQSVMQALWGEMNHLVAEPGPRVLYILGWALVLVLTGDVCLQALPQLALRRSRAPVRPVALDGRPVAFAPTRRFHSAPRLFAIGCHLLIGALLASLWVVLAYRESCWPLLEALLLLPLVPLREPRVGVAFLACVVLIWSGFRFRSLWSASLTGFALVAVSWVFLVAWVSVLKPFDRLPQVHYPNPGLVSWVRQTWESAWQQKPSAHGFLVLGTGLFLIGIPTICLSFRRPREKRKRLFSIAYLPGARWRRSRE